MDCRRTLYSHWRAWSKRYKILCFDLLLPRSGMLRAQDSPMGRTSGVLKRWLAWLGFEEPSDVTQSLPWLCRQLARATLGLPGVRAWDGSTYLSDISCCLLVPLRLHDLGLPQDCFSCPPQGYCWSLSQQPILRAEQKNDEVSWCDVCCSSKGYGSDSGSRSE